MKIIRMAAKPDVIYVFRHKREEGGGSVLCCKELKPHDGVGVADEG